MRKVSSAKLSLKLSAHGLRVQGRNSGEAMKNGKREGGGFAGAGLGDAKQVASFHHAGNCGELDRGGLRIALAGERREDRGVQAKVFELGQRISVFRVRERADACLLQVRRRRCLYGTARRVRAIMRSLQGAQRAGSCSQDPHAAGAPIAFCLRTRGAYRG